MTNSRIISEIKRKLNFYTSGTEVKFTNCALIFAFNGTGKTRLSYDFAHKDREEGRHHTLYYNAFTEDLFTCNNDLKNDSERYMKINSDSELIKGFDGYEYDAAINKILETLTNFKAHFERSEHAADGTIIQHDDDTIPREVWFSRTLKKPIRHHDGTAEYKEIETEHIKISRGEERLFVWSVFRYIMDLVISKDPRFKVINNIRYIYIDDPMSSLDDNNIMRFAAQLCDVINKCHDEVMEYEKSHAMRDDLGLPKFIISTHHSVFFNTMFNGLKGVYAWKLSRDVTDNRPDQLLLTPHKEKTPMYYHLSVLAQIKKELDAYRQTGQCCLQKYHFNMLRGIVEQLAQFSGQRSNGSMGHVLDGIVYHFNRQEYTAADEGYERLSANAINIMSHSANSMFETTMLNPDSIQIIDDIYTHIVKKYHIDENELSAGDDEY